MSDEHGERLVRLETQMKTALEGVGNFRVFQTEAREFFDDARAFQQASTIRDEEKMKYQESLAKALDVREKKADRWWKRILTWLLIIGAIVTILTTFRPVIQNWLHIPVASANAPKAQSMNQPQLAGKE